MSSSCNGRQNSTSVEDTEKNAFPNQNNLNSGINSSIEQSIASVQPYIAAAQLEPRSILDPHDYNFTHVRERYWIEQTTILNEIKVDEQGRETWSARLIGTKWIEKIQSNGPEPAAQSSTQLPPLLAASSASIMAPPSPLIGINQEAQNTMLAERSLDTFWAVDLFNDDLGAINWGVEMLLPHEIIPSKKASLPISNRQIFFIYFDFDFLLENYLCFLCIPFVQCIVVDVLRKEKHFGGTPERQS